MPRWNPNGRELFYLRRDGMLMSVEVELGDEIRPGRPQELFSLGLPSTQLQKGAFDVSEDGERFLIALPKSDYTPSITIVSDWRQ